MKYKHDKNFKKFKNVRTTYRPLKFSIYAVFDSLSSLSIITFRNHEYKITRQTNLSKPAIYPKS